MYVHTPQNKRIMIRKGKLKMWKSINASYLMCILTH